MKEAGESLVPVCTDKAEDLELRANMAYASLISGIGLANVGLGIVHGLASPLGGFFVIPHGIVCGTLFGEAVKINIELLKEKEAGDKYLQKYARIGAYWAGEERLFYQEGNIDKCCQLLVKIIEDWLEKLEIPRLGEFGVGESDLDKIAEKAGNKNNPVKLDKEQIKELVRRRL